MIALLLCFETRISSEVSSIVGILGTEVVGMYLDPTSILSNKNGFVKHFLTLGTSSYV